MEDEAKQPVQIIPRPKSTAFTLVPRTLNEAIEFSRLITSSEMCPKEYRGKPQDALIAIQMGAELGIAPMQSLQSIMVLNGRPSMWGDVVLGLVQASGLLESIIERDPQEAAAEGEGRCEVRRKGMAEPTVRTFTREMAETAGLKKRGGPDAPWARYEGRMLQMRARSWALRDLFGDVLKGLQIREEVGDYPPEPAPIQMPERASTQEVDNFVRDPTGKGKGRAATLPLRAQSGSTESCWVGQVEGVTERTGETKGRKWRLWVIKGRDGTEFGTFHTTNANFARSAGDLLVKIAWKDTTKGGKELISIEPGEEQAEQGDE